MVEGTTCRNRTVSSDSHLQIGQRWSDWHHLDSSGAVNHQFQGPCVRIFLRPNLGIVAVHV